MTASGLARTRLLALATNFARALHLRSALKSKRAQGRPGADLAPAVCCAKGTRRRTAQQHTGGANHSAFPARWSDGLCRALPGAELSLWPPSRSRNSPAPRRSTRSPPPQELDRSNDGQDHTVLPYARPAMFATGFDDAVHVAANPRARRTCQRRSSARCPGLTESNPPCPGHSRPTLPRPPQARLAKTTTT